MRDHSHTIHRTNKSLINGPLNKRYGISDDDQRSRKNSCRSKARNSSSDDKSDRCRCHSANQGPKFEDGNGSEIDPLDGKEGVELAKKELKGAGCEKICRAVPSYVIERVELVGDSGDRRSNDRVVLSRSISTSVRYGSFVQRALHIRNTTTRLPEE